MKLKSMLPCKGLVLAVIIVCSFQLSYAQQWSGSSTTSGTIRRVGDIEIGNNQGISTTTRLYVNDGRAQFGYDGARTAVLIRSGANKHIVFDTNDGTERMKILSTGRVGIGTSSPKTKLEVDGDISMSRSHRLTFLTATGGNERAFIGSTNGQNGDYNGLIFGTGSGNEQMRIKSDGNVGIGTTDPGNYKLAVNGTIRAKEIKVETGWADFVFEEDYLLRSLNEVEQYIKEHKHLPDVPSAKEVEENGVQLGEISSKLLQKIEELTLYVIAQDKRIETLEAEKEDLQKAAQK